MLKKLRIPIIIVGVLILVASVITNGAELGTLAFAFSEKAVWVGAAFLLFGIGQTIKAHFDERSAFDGSAPSELKPQISGRLIALELITITSPLWAILLFGPMMGFAAILLLPMLGLFVSGPALVSTVIVAFLPKSLSQSARIMSWIGITLLVSLITYFVVHTFYLVRTTTLTSGEKVEKDITMVEFFDDPSGERHEAIEKQAADYRAELAARPTYVSREFGFSFNYPSKMTVEELDGSQLGQPTGDPKLLKLVRFDGDSKSRTGRFLVGIYPPRNETISSESYLNGTLGWGTKCDYRSAPLFNKGSVKTYNGITVLEAYNDGCYFFKNANGNLIAISSYDAGYDIPSNVLPTLKLR